MAANPENDLLHGAPAPGFDLRGLDGDRVTLESLSERGRPVLLIFAEPDGGPCEELFPEIAGWQEEHAGRLTIAVISGGNIGANRNRRDRYGLRHVLLQADGEVAQAYRMNEMPAAVLIRQGKVAGTPARGAAAIRTLVVRSALPPALQQGDVVPSMRLPDLDGETFDLSTLRGRPTLLLFWNPDCVYCQSMLADLKTQERVRVTNAPDLLVIAAGSAEANRAQGLRSRVLLDPHFAAATLFGVTGTPAAVVVNEDGRVASDIGIGGRGTFELLGFLPYAPTPDATVAAMLELARVGPADTVYDLGCGDGRVVIAAARKYGAHAVGADIDPERLDEARDNARIAMVEHLVRFEERELLQTDIRAATVVTFYLLPKINLQLRSKLLNELRAGTRVVSHAFDMQDWKPDREEIVDGNRIYLWTIPPHAHT